MDNPNYSEMSDDDFETELVSGASPSGEEVTEPVDTETNLQTEGDEPQTEDVIEEADEATTLETDEEDADEETEGDEPDEETDAPDTTEESEATLDPQLEELFAPFKASGSEMQVQSVAEARQLMQKGVDYQNKMREFKPHRKTIKMLENNKIDETKLNYFIDLANGDKAAIAKLIKDNEFDVHDPDLEETSYSPSDHSVSDTEVDLDDVISRIQTSDSFSTTTDIVSNQWDTASKQAVFENPVILENLNIQVANGTYARVKQEVTRLQAFGGLQGLTDLQAYHKVGMDMEQAGKFNTPAQPPKVVTTKPKKVSKMNTDKKRSASPSKRISSTPTANKNYEQMGDAEFEKLLNK